MNVQVKALTHFVHGAVNLSRGQAAVLPQSTAQDLEKAGLVEVLAGSVPPVVVPASAVVVKVAPKPANKAVKPSSNKAAP